MIHLSRLSLGALLALVTYHPGDPSPNTAAGGPVANWAGAAGAWLADILLSLFGPPVILLLPLALAVGLRLLRGVEAGRWLRSLFVTLLGLALIGLAVVVARRRRRMDFRADGKGDSAA